MRIPAISLVSGVLASLLFAGTAGAAPFAQAFAGKDPTKSNPIYDSGRFRIKSCDEQPTQPDDLDAARVDLEFLLDCLNTGWGDHLTEANFAFAKPKLVTTTRTDLQTGCGKYPKTAQAVYCPNNQRITFRLDRDILSKQTELLLFATIAHEYGHHVQQLTGIMTSYLNRKYRNKAAELDATRRMELQAECFGGAFIGSVWMSLGRRKRDLNYMIKVAIGNATHGKHANIAYWIRRGFAADSPDACNTFTAPAAKVA
ncbi:neutral zinc metallopeptidase [Streptosporangium sp. NPDC020145]|uniref:neutral zinc metallopeptidase n=1 Tax=Streptosporangium sp. NPDC020145 TaxID=3154694 RepID=UPI003427AD0F